ncbi:MAG: hypothetical protein WC742_08070 [Gallionellaceae bacterium]|jgi:hypothetical protein
MKVTLRLKKLAVGFGLLVLSATSFAVEQKLDTSLPDSRLYSSKSIILAANEVDAVSPKSSDNHVKPATEFEPPLISGSNMHKYLGLGTIALAVATAMTAPEECESAGCDSIPRDTTGTHAQLAYATVGVAAATIASGLLTHWDDFSLEDGWTDPDNLHVLLGVTGAAMMAYAVQQSASVKTGQASHAGLAEAGALGMLVAIKLTW